MALFSRLRSGGGAPDTTIARAVLAPAVLTMAADGSVDKAELVQLNNVCGFSPIFGPLGPETVTRLVTEILNDLSKRGPHEVITGGCGQAVSSPARDGVLLCHADRDGRRRSR